MGNRGHERNVVCVQCGRSSRRDKAIVIEKMTFSNPLERKDVVSPDEYSRGTYREVWYCPSCGKHGRIYEKKKKLMAKQRERASLLEARRATFRRHQPKKPAFSETQSEPMLDLTVHEEGEEKKEEQAA